MAIYMIGYDLHRSTGQNYNELFAALEAIGSGYWDCLEFDVARHDGENASPNTRRTQTAPKGWRSAARHALWWRRRCVAWI